MRLGYFGPSETLPATDDDGAPLSYGGVGPGVAVTCCGRCGTCYRAVALALRDKHWCIRVVDCDERSVGPLVSGEVVCGVRRPACDCWRLGTREAVDALLASSVPLRPAFKSRHLFMRPEGATAYGACLWCKADPMTALDPVFCTVGPPNTPAATPSDTPAGDA